MDRPLSDDQAARDKLAQDLFNILMESNTPKSPPTCTLLNVDSQVAAIRKIALSLLRETNLKALMKPNSAIHDALLTMCDYIDLRYSDLVNEIEKFASNRNLNTVSDDAFLFNVLKCIHYEHNEKCWKFDLSIDAVFSGELESKKQQFTDIYIRKEQECLIATSKSSSVPVEKEAPAPNNKRSGQQNKKSSNSKEAPEAKKSRTTPPLPTTVQKPTSSVFLKKKAAESIASTSIVGVQDSESQKPVPKPDPINSQVPGKARFNAPNRIFGPVLKKRVQNSLTGSISNPQAAKSIASTSSQDSEGQKPAPKSDPINSQAPGKARFNAPNRIFGPVLKKRVQNSLTGSVPNPQAAKSIASTSSQDSEGQKSVPKSDPINSQAPRKARFNAPNRIFAPVLEKHVQNSLTGSISNPQAAKSIASTSSQDSEGQKSVPKSDPINSQAPGKARFNAPNRIFAPVLKKRVQNSLTGSVPNPHGHYTNNIVPSTSQQGALMNYPEPAPTPLPSHYGHYNHHRPGPIFASSPQFPIVYASVPIVGSPIFLGYPNIGHVPSSIGPPTANFGHFPKIFGPGPSSNGPSASNLGPVETNLVPHTSTYRPSSMNIASSALNVGLPPSKLGPHLSTSRQSQLHFGPGPSKLGPHLSTSGQSQLHYGPPPSNFGPSLSKFDPQMQLDRPNRPHPEQLAQNDSAPVENQPCANEPSIDNSTHSETSSDNIEADQIDNDDDRENVESVDMEESEDSVESAEDIIIDRNSTSGDSSNLEDRDELDTSGEDQNIEPGHSFGTFSPIEILDVMRNLRNRKIPDIDRFMSSIDDLENIENSATYPAPVAPIQFTNPRNNFGSNSINSVPRQKRAARVAQKSAAGMAKLEKQLRSKSINPESQKLEPASARKSRNSSSNPTRFSSRISAKQRDSKKPAPMAPKSRRARSLDADLSLTVTNHGFRRSESVISINDLENYAKKRARLAKNIYLANEDSLLYEEHEYFDDNLLLDGKLIFKPIDNDDTSKKSKKFGLISSMLSRRPCFRINSAEDNEKYSKILKKFSLLKFWGSAEKSRAEEGVLIAGQSIGAVADELLKFNLFILEKMQEVEEFLKELQSLKHSRNRKRYTLIDTYHLVFRAWGSIFEDFLYQLRAHIFNPLSVFEAENSQNTNSLRSSIEKRKAEIGIIFDNIFDLSVLKDQLRDIRSLSRSNEEERIRNTCTMLSALAIERIRPSPEVANILGDRPWLKRLEDVTDSFSLVKFSTDDFYPNHRHLNIRSFSSKIRENHFDHSFSNPSMNDRKNDSFTALFKGLFYQKDIFKSSFHEEFPGCKVDGKMGIFYELQLAQNLRNLVNGDLTLTNQDMKDIPEIVKTLIISSIASSSKPCFDLRHCAADLDEAYKKLMNIKEPAGSLEMEPPMIQPPNNGFVIYSSEKFCTFAIFGERQTPIWRAPKQNAHVYLYLNCEMDYDFENVYNEPRGNCRIWISKESGKIFIQILDEKLEPKSNAFHFTTIPEIEQYDTINWPMIYSELLDPNMNFIKETMRFRLGGDVEWPWEYYNRINMGQMMRNRPITPPGQPMNEEIGLNACDIPFEPILGPMNFVPQDVIRVPLNLKPICYDEMIDEAFDDDDFFED